MGMITPETDTGGRADRGVDYAGTVLAAILARNAAWDTALDQAAQAARPISALVALNTMPTEVRNEFMTGDQP